MNAATIVTLAFVFGVAVATAYFLGVDDGRTKQAALMRDARDTNSKAAKHLAQLRDARSDR